MKKAPVFQTDDIYDEPKENCKCQYKRPHLNGRNNHWVCALCGLMVSREDRAII